MALETTTTAPKVADFTALSDHQAQTPKAFYGAKPVLHLHSTDASVSISNTDLDAQPALQGLVPDNASIQANGADSESSVNINGLDIWVTSQHLTLFAPAKSYGVHIHYQSIVVHAAEGDEVLLGLNLSDENTADEDMTFVQLRLTPKTSKKHPSNTSAAAEGMQADLALFNAISACQELNPDSVEEGEEEENGGFDETAPGATGWITTENMADFLDENGEFKMPRGMTVVGAEDGDGAGGMNGLGEGAGRIRTAAEVDGQDGGEDESKWQRTG